MTAFGDREVFESCSGNKDRFSGLKSSGRNLNREPAGGRKDKLVCHALVRDSAKIGAHGGI